MLRPVRSLFSMKAIFPPGDSPSIIMATIAARYRPSISAMALKACGVSSSLNPELTANNNSASKKEGQDGGKAPAAGINAADLTDEEVTRCLQVLPHYANLAATDLSAASAARSLARGRLGTSVSARRNAIRDLRWLLFSNGWVASEQEAQQMSLSEMRDRFGDRPEVVAFVRKFLRTFTLDVDQVLSSSHKSNAIPSKKIKRVSVGSSSSPASSSSESPDLWTETTNGDASERRSHISDK